jgi:hypothetical protein
VPGAGTVLALELWDGSAPSRPPAACLCRPMTGEEVSGDAIAIRQVDARVVLLVSTASVTGRLLHGPLTPRCACSKTSRSRVRQPRCRACTERCRARAVAAIAVADIDAKGRCPLRRHREHRGVDRRRGGQPARARFDAGHCGSPDPTSPESSSTSFQRVSRVVLHSDGLTSKWSTSPALLRRDPILGAAVLLRDAGTRRDDASVVVAEAPCTL